MKKLVAILTFLLILAGCSTVKVEKVDDDNNTDAIRFNKEYKLNDKNNVYKYATYDNVIDKLKKESGIIYLGFPSCTLCKEIVPVLNESAKENNINSILYYNFKDIRDNNTDEYVKLKELISEYITLEEYEKIKAPTVIFVNKGDIVGIYIGNISSDKEEILTEEEKISLKQQFESLINKINKTSTSTVQKEDNY